MLHQSVTDEEPMSVTIGEPLLSDYSVHELPSQEDDRETSTALDDKESSTALAAQVEYLEGSHIDNKKAP